MNGSVALLRYLCTKGSTQQISAVQLASTSAARPPPLVPVGTLLHGEKGY